MKSQTDLIISIVAMVLALGIGAGLFFTKREPQTPAAAPTPIFTPAALPPGDIVLTNGLAGGTNTPGGGGGAAPGGGRAGFSGGGKLGGPAGIGG